MFMVKAAVGQHVVLGEDGKRCMARLDLARHLADAGLASWCEWGLAYLRILRILRIGSHCFPAGHPVAGMSAAPVRRTPLSRIRRCLPQTLPASLKSYLL
jgi:hypothetical protein